MSKFEAGLLAICIISMLVQWVATDRLLIRWQETDFDDWKRSGEPTGYFWRPNVSMFKFSMGWAWAFGWLFQTPEWARKANMTGIDFLLLRLSSVINLLSFSVFLVIFSKKM